MSSLPLWQASCRGVLPLLSVALTNSICDASHSTCSASAAALYRAARWMGSALPIVFRIEGFALRFSSSLTTSGLPA